MKRSILGLSLLCSLVLVYATGSRSSAMQPDRAISSNCQLAYRAEGLPNAPRVIVDRAFKKIKSFPSKYIESPDGATLASIEPVGPNLGLFLAPADNPAAAKQVQVAGVQVTNPAWSPDGKQIGFTGYQGAVYNIYAANADGSNPHNLTNSQAQNDYAAWSSDGKQIAFRSNRQPPNQLWIMNADGSNPKSYAAGGPPYVWSPNRRYMAAQPDPNEIQIVDLTSGKVQSVSGGNVQRISPTWSPDSAWVGFLLGGAIELPAGGGPVGGPAGGGPAGGPPPGGTPRAIANAYAFVKMHPDTSAQTPVTPADLPVREAKWAPDVDQIAFVGQDGQLYLINGDGAGLVKVNADGADRASLLHWVCLAGR